MQSSTKVFPCKCESEFQDKLYGKGMRIFNVRLKKDAKRKVLPMKDQHEFRCTVCGAIQSK